MIKGKLALVTGSTSGIGLAIATKLASEGANIIINGFGNPEEIEKIRKNLSETYKVSAFYYEADMSKPSEIEAMIKNYGKDFGGIDILVNNAGIQFVAPVDEFPSEKWDEIIAINLSSSFHTVRHSLPYMKKKGWGRIINIASAHALIASPFKSAYVSAKHGLAGFTKTIALEVAEQNITVNAICPGYVLTPLVQKQIPDTAKVRGISEEDVIREVMLAEQSTKKFVRVEEIADLACFLCGNNAESLTGAILSLDGGWSAH